MAVSGGGDSMALMHLMAAAARAGGLPLPVVVTVDHALRPHSAAEARQVAAWAGEAGLEAQILTRKGPLPQSDIEAKAREARYRLIGRWCRMRGIEIVALAHTCDDQAETFLMRLMRGSGVDGLSAMHPLSAFPTPGFPGLSLWRPLLSQSRETLRAYLAAGGRRWIEDPMNDDARFTRVRLRQAWPALEALGFDKRRLADTAAHLARARAALEIQTDTLAASACRVVSAAPGKIAIDVTVLAKAPQEIGLRVLARSLASVSGRVYRPRFERLLRLYRAVTGEAPFSACTLHGCRITLAPKRLCHAGSRTALIFPEAGRRPLPPKIL